MAAVVSLLDGGASPEARDGGGFSALIKAVAGGHGAVVEVLLARGAAVDGERGRHTALRAAALFGRVDLLRLLLARGGDARIESNNGRTPLMGACFPRAGVPPDDALACVAALLDDSRGAAAIDARNDDGDTALHLAIARGLAAAARLLAARGARTDLPNGAGVTAARLAADARLDLGRGPCGAASSSESS